MDYIKLRKLTGKILKFQTPAGPIFSNPDLLSEYEYLVKNGYSPELALSQIKRDATLDLGDAIDPSEESSFTVDEALSALDLVNTDLQKSEKASKASAAGQKAAAAFAAMGKAVGEAAWNMGKSELSALGGQMGEMGVSSMESGMKSLIAGDKDGLGLLYAGAVTSAMGVTENSLMGDKNFGAQSLAIDQTVHGVSGALMKSGNPYAALAGVALEGANFLTKAGGQTVQGFDVNINNSGYGNLGHMESSSSRDFGSLFGLGGLSSAKMLQKLAKRNEQARMALKAASISEDQSFEQKARMDSVTNTIMQNQLALAGGINLQNI